MSGRIEIVRAPRAPSSVSDGRTHIPTAILQDSSLSYRARGVLTFLLSCPPAEDADTPTIIDSGTEGREAVRTALRELEAAGYITWRPVSVPQPHGGVLIREVIDVYDLQGAAPPSARRKRRASKVRELAPDEHLAGRFDENSLIPRRGYAVYRLYGHDDRLLYVGRTEQPRQRMRSHLNARGPELLARWEMVGCVSFTEMCDLEAALIAQHQPPFNRDAP